MHSDSQVDALTVATPIVEEPGLQKTLQSAEISLKGFPVTDLKIINEKGFKYGTGALTNRSGRTLNYCLVQVNFLDSSGRTVGSNDVSINNLAPGDKWKFKFLVVVDSAIKLKVVEVSGY